MQHLYRHHHEAYRQDGFFDTSAAHQALTAARDHVHVRTCLQVVRDGWVQDVDEQQAGRSLLLGYLGTFPAATHGAPSASRTWQDEHRAFYRMATGDPLNTSVVYHMTGGGTQPLPELDDPMGPPAPSVAMEVALRLVAMGANPWTRDADGRDALDQAMSLGWLPLYRAMLRRPDAPVVDDLAFRRMNVPFLHSPGSHQQMVLPWLHAMVAFGRDACLDDLLDLGMDVNQRDDLGRTPLFYAQLTGTVQRLLDRGADPLALDTNGANAGLVWTRLVESSTQLSQMNSVLNERAKPLFEADPSAFLNMHRPTLYDMVRSGTKDNVLKFLKSHGFSVNDRRDNGQSLLGHAALTLLSQHDRSPAVAMHLLDRVDDPWHVGVTGVPDVVLVWFGTQFNQTHTAWSARQAVNQRMQTRYTWTTDKGYASFMQAMNDAAEVLVAHSSSWAAVVGSALASGLERSMKGDTTPETKTERAVTTPFAPAKWAQIQDRSGQSIGWRVGATAAALMQREPTLGAALPQNLGRALRSLVEGDRYSYNADKPRVPYDSLAMQALLVPLGWYDPNARNRGLNGFQRDDVFHQAFQAAMKQGVDLNPSGLGFEVAMQALRKKDMTLALLVENVALRQGLEQILDEAPAAEPRPRRRM